MKWHIWIVFYVFMCLMVQIAIFLLFLNDLAHEPFGGIPKLVAIVFGDIVAFAIYGIMCVIKNQRTF